MDEDERIETAARSLHAMMQTKVFAPEDRTPWDYIPAYQQEETRRLVRCVLRTWAETAGVT
jgi:hypothetical protein